LLDHAVDYKRIRRIPTVQVRTSAHDTNASERAVIRNTKNLVTNAGRLKWRQ
jgi:hypothetical protein